MDTPVCDFVSHYLEKDSVRLHMPGHKGRKNAGSERDITEIDGADVLFRAKGILRRSEENAASLFGTSKTLYSAEGSSLCIRAMLYLVKLYAKSEKKRPLIAAGRNAHQVFMTAAALLDLEILWLYPQKNDSLVCCEISADTLDRTLTQAPEKPTAVYVTSPDYLGNIADIASLSEICRKHGVLLLVDNAHGAYLRFLPQSCHPMDLGADLCCDSAHKTLPVLTGGAYLHFSFRAPEQFRRQAEGAMSLFASTSPSYLILQSLDAANRELAESYRDKLAETAERLRNLKERLLSAGYLLLGNEPMKLTLSLKPFGYSGTEFADMLAEKGIFCEFADPDFVVMMFSPENNCADFERLQKALLSVEKKPPLPGIPPVLSPAEQAMPAKQALFSPQEEIPVSEALGRILAAANIACPPAVPIAVCGERINESMIRCFRYYGYDFCSVVAE